MPGSFDATLGAQKPLTWQALPCGAVGGCKLACYRPIRAYLRSEGGPVSFSEVKNSTSVDLPCGRCIGCRKERARSWMIRAVHEAQLHTENSFVTLTYGPGNLPAHGSLCYRDVQLFIKRFRKARGPFRYLVCGEYGAQLLRPHYHMIMFGVGFPDRLRIRKTRWRIPHRPILKRGNRSLAAHTPLPSTHIHRQNSL